MSSAGTACCEKKAQEERETDTYASPQPREAVVEEELVLIEEHPVQHEKVTLLQGEKVETKKEKRSIEKLAEEKKPVIQQVAQTKSDTQPEKLKKEKTSTETSRPKSVTVQKKKEFTPPQSSDGFWD